MRSLLPLLLLAGCGGGPACGDWPVDGGDSAPLRRYVINKILLPVQRSDYAFDLNGDKRADNQFGNIVGAFSAQNINSQGSTDDAVKRGVAPLLVSLASNDLDDQDRPTATLQLGRRQTPDFASGRGTFTVDEKRPAAHFTGCRHGATFESRSPLLADRPVTAIVPIALIPNADPMLLPVEGAHLRFDTGTDQASGQPGLVAGQIHGALSRATADDILVPAIAAMLNADILGGCSSGTCDLWAMQLLSIFDTGGCETAHPGDWFIDVCEVQTNAIIVNVLSPDVDLYDPDGRYAPNPSNTGKESLSFAVGFTAVAAQF